MGCLGWRDGSAAGGPRRASEKLEFYRETVGLGILGGEYSEAWGLSYL